MEEPGATCRENQRMIISRRFVNQEADLLWIHNITDFTKMLKTEKIACLVVWALGSKLCSSVTRISQEYLGTSLHSYLFVYPQVWSHLLELLDLLGITGTIQIFEFQTLARGRRGVDRGMSPQARYSKL